MVNTPNKNWPLIAASQAQKHVTHNDALMQIDAAIVGAQTFTMVGVGGATADSYNRLSVNSPATLLNHDGASHEVTINKAASGNDAALSFKVGFSVRALFGLLGVNDFVIKTSVDGATFLESIRARVADGIVSFAQGVLASGFKLRDQTDVTKTALFSLANITTNTTRTYTLPNNNGVLALNSVFTSTGNGLVPLSGGGTSTFLRADGTWAVPASGGGSVADGDKGDVIVSASGAVWSLDYGAVNAAVAPTFANISGKPTTISGYGITDAVDLSSAQSIGGAKNFTGSVTFTGQTITSDSNFTLQDDIDANKKVRFQLDSITTSTTRTLTVPDASGTISLNFGGTGTITLLNAVQEWRETITAAGVTPFSRIILAWAGENDTLENSPEMLDSVNLSGTAGNGTIDIIATFSELTSGPINIIWSTI